MPVAAVASSLRLLTLILLVAIASGCADDDDEPPLVRSELPRLVLQPDDLTPEWSSFDEGRQARADALTGARADPGRFGRLDGWKARYRRPGSVQTEGPLVVESRADLFGAVSGAEQDFDAAVEELEQSTGPSRPVERLDLGDEGRSLVGAAGSTGELVTVTVVWRERNVVATVTANGFSGSLSAADVAELARLQQQRLASARDA